MEVDKFVQEMLNEVTNLKDLAKEELPIVAKEYIKAYKVKTIFGLIVGALLLLLAMSSGAYALFGKFSEYHNDDAAFFCLFGIVSGIAGLITVWSITDLIDIVCQPRRLAILAITSLVSKE